MSECFNWEREYGMRRSLHVRSLHVRLCFRCGSHVQGELAEQHEAFHRQIDDATAGDAR